MANGETTINNGHSHRYIIDEKGDGSTSRNKAHEHNIINWKVQTAHGHKHGLEK